MSRSASLRRHWATLAWSPDVRTSGIGPALEIGGPGVLRIFEQAVGEAFLDAGGFLAHHAGNQPDAGVDQRQRGRFAARQHEIAERDFLELARRDQPLIDALEAPAHDDGAGTGSQLAHARLRQRRAARAHQQARARIGRQWNRARAPAHRPSSPCRGRRRPAYRRRCGACRWRDRGCRWPRATTVWRPALCRRGSTASGPGNISGKIVRTLARHIVIRPRRRVRALRSRPAARRRSAWPRGRSSARRVSLNGSISGSPPPTGMISIISPAPKLCSA